MQARRIEWWLLWCDAKRKWVKQSRLHGDGREVELQLARALTGVAVGISIPVSTPAPA